MFALALFSVVPAHAAAPEATIGKDDCKLVTPKPVAGEKVKWRGACKDGYADGPGTFDWYVDGELRLHFEGILQRGRTEGLGYTRTPSRTQYEGYFHDNHREGYGIEQTVELDRYEGDWKRGVPHGAGKKVFWDGSSYEGQWQAGQPHGAGKAVYTSGRVFEGQFKDGRAVGLPPPQGKNTGETYSMATGPAGVGSYIKSANLTGGVVPYAKAWDGLTKDQQQTLRSDYGMLLEEDEPPYPAAGIGKLYSALGKAQNWLAVDGQLRMVVMVDRSGTPSKVTVFMSPDPKMTEFATEAVMLEKFKPALCSGTPCPMSFAITLNFKTTAM
ncbi:MAG: energy transducer TonB [Pseudomonadota bacterium]